MVDDAKLHQFMGQMLSDLGGAASVALVRIGDALGLYKTLHEQGPMTVPEFAAASGVNQRYLREWLSHQAASNYLSYDPTTQKFALPPEQAMVFAVEDSPVYMMGAFDLMTRARIRFSQYSRPVVGCRGAITPLASSAWSGAFSGPDTIITW